MGDMQNEVEDIDQEVIGVEPGTYGEEFLSWETYDRPKYERGPRWYWLMAVGCLGLLIYAVASANFLFALIVLMCAIIVYLSTLVEPRLIRVALTETGIAVGTAFYPFREIARFWFVYEPPVVRSLYLEVRKGVGSRLAIDVGDMNPNEVRKVLGEFLHEDLVETDEPMADILSRLFRI